jgi:hypothetical protein
VVERLSEAGVLRDTAKLDKLYHLARTMLNEEATRCAVLIFTLKELGNTREDREAVRRCVVVEHTYVHLYAPQEHP